MTIPSAVRLATIANGATVSSAIDCGGMVPVAFITPAALTSTAITFQASYDHGNTFVAVYKDSSQLSYTVSTSRHNILNPADWMGVTDIKVVGGSAEGGDRIIPVLLADL